MLSVLLPTEVIRFVPDQAKARFLGELAGAGALIALLAHPLVGALSDRTRGRLGRRRPYLVAGTLAAAVALVWMALASSFAWLLTGFLLLQLSANVASSPYQAYIPDLVPADQRGAASGYMGLMSMLGAIASLGLAAALVRPGRTLPFYPWLVGVLLAGMWITIRRVPEAGGRPPDGAFWRSLWVSPRA